METMTVLGILDPTDRLEEPDEGRDETTNPALEAELEEIERTFSDRWEW